MSNRDLDHLIEQNETELGFLSAYGGGESSEELFEKISKMVSKNMRLKNHEEGVEFSMRGKLPLVSSDINRRGFLHGKLDDKGVKVVITDLGPEQLRFIERLVEFNHD
ncbi:MAG: hypothetical protein QGI21_03760 [Candidatus Poseidoniaceae archaeon]|jgi:hypothetical protein|nr:hypothetical protein [Candidatus Poseidoniaceae archaeon]